MAVRAGKAMEMLEPAGFEGPSQSTIGLNETFLGELLSPDEYTEACRNLGAFFEILHRWQKEAES